MMGKPTFVKLDPKITKYAISLHPEFGAMVEDDGYLYTELLKALYGCVQAIVVWIDSLVSRELGL
jgi:hypothetical protein